MQFILYCFILIQLSLVVEARNIFLFKERNKPVENYNDLVKQIKKGDRIYFSNGKYFEIGQLLGVGGTTMIFTNNQNPNVAIRIAKSSQ